MLRHVIQTYVHHSLEHSGSCNSLRPEKALQVIFLFNEPPAPIHQSPEYFTPTLKPIWPYLRLRIGPLNRYGKKPSPSLPTSSSSSRSCSNLTSTCVISLTDIARTITTLIRTSYRRLRLAMHHEHCRDGYRSGRSHGCTNYERRASIISKQI